MKLVDKNIATKLRKLGRSYGEILKRVPVSKSTLSVWLRNIELTDKQKTVLLLGRQRARYAGAKARQQQRITRSTQIVEQSKKEIDHLYKKPLFVSGLMLYWAEGDKSDTLEHVKFTNSDPALIQLMMRWFREICAEIGRASCRERV